MAQEPARKRTRRAPAEVRRARALALHAGGATNRQIAAELGVRAEQVSRWLHEPEAQAVRESTRTRALARAESLADDAMGCLEQIMRDGEASHADRRQAAVAILDRAGVAGATKVEHSGAVASPAASMDHRALLERARALLEPDGEPDDAGDDGTSH